MNKVNATPVGSLDMRLKQYCSAAMAVSRAEELSYVPNIGRGNLLPYCSRFQVLPSSSRKDLTGQRHSSSQSLFTNRKACRTSSRGRLFSFSAPTSCGGAVYCEANAAINALN